MQFQATLLASKVKFVA